MRRCVEMIGGVQYAVTCSALASRMDQVQAPVPVCRYR